MMSTPEQPQIYIVTPPEFELSRFPGQLAEVLDSHDIACVRLALATRDEDRIARAADALREVTHARDVALVIDSHILMVERLGLDGVHLPDGARNVRKARKELGEDAIVGAFCGASRHDGMNAGEAGADYVSFGPLSGATLGDGTLAEREIFEWWSLMIELPVVAEGGLTPAIIRDLAPVTDFFAIGPEIWGAGDPASELAALKAAMG
jgi:thiamine-phosphate pyrophosphorylase